MEQTNVAVIGAGPAGLAVAACLRKAGVDFIVLEKEELVGAAWRRHYKRLHLHTVKRFSSLPFRPFDRSYPRYVPRAEVVRYLESYAADFDIKPRFGEAVRSVRRDANTWIVESESNSFHAESVVIASGMNTDPVMPDFSGRENFKGRALHSAEYVDSAPFRQQRVLVVGMGNTGAEIALDLAEGGAETSVSVRNGVHMVPRDLFGIPIQVVATAASVLPSRANDTLIPFILDLALGDLAKFGIKRPKQGIFEQVAKSHRIPVLDVGTAKKISEGAIKVMPGISTVTDDGVVFTNGEKRLFDAIIFATGYRPSYRSFLASDDIAPGLERNNDGTGIYFVGFHVAITGQLREISKEATRVASEIASRSNVRAPG
jgi:NADPH-dependent 2,4-dienoyl-CoA reductase/sulfur reductase-like enzyme